MKKHYKAIKLTNPSDIALLDEILNDADYIIEEQRQAAEALDKEEAERIIKKQLIKQKYARKKEVFDIDKKIIVYYINGEVYIPSTTCRELAQLPEINMLPSSVLQYVKKGAILRDKYKLNFIEIGVDKND